MTSAERRDMSICPDWQIDLRAKCRADSAKLQRPKLTNLPPSAETRAHRSVSASHSAVQAMSSPQRLIPLHRARHTLRTAATALTPAGLLTRFPFSGSVAERMSDVAVHESLAEVSVKATRPAYRICGSLNCILKPWPVVRSTNPVKRRINRSFLFCILRFFYSAGIC